MADFYVGHDVLFPLTGLVDWMNFIVAIVHLFRVDELVTCEAWKLQKKASAEEGIIATAYERKHSEWRYVAIGLSDVFFILHIRNIF